LDLIDNLFF